MRGVLVSDLLTRDGPHPVRCPRHGDWYDTNRTCRTCLHTRITLAFQRLAQRKERP